MSTSLDAVIRPVSAEPNIQADTTFGDLAKTSAAPLQSRADIGQDLLTEAIEVSHVLVDHFRQNATRDTFVPMDDEVPKLHHLPVGLIFRESAELNATLHRFASRRRRRLTG
jgi:hypothetical protein